MTKKLILSKYVSASGICSRRKASVLIKDGHVSVNGEKTLIPYYEVKSDDCITFDGKEITPEEKVYIVLNKPRGYLTTLSDTAGRKTVLSLVKSATHLRIYPVGRLDCNSTGLLVFTNDGEFAQALSHPSYEVKKIYHVVLDHSLKRVDFNKIKRGIMLDDGMLKVDDIIARKSEVQLEIHSGRNRIIRRLFKSLGYEVSKLDRIGYAGITLKDVPRGKWRYLSKREIKILKNTA